MNNQETWALTMNVADEGLRQRMKMGNVERQASREEGWVKKRERMVREIESKGRERENGWVKKGLRMVRKIKGKGREE